MDKKEISLIDQFKKVEGQIIDELKATELSVDYEADNQEILASLKNYVLKVKSVEKLFDEYEAIAKKIEKLTGDEIKKQSITEAVVDMREDSDELKEEIEIIKGEPIAKKKKKKTNTAVKEL